MRSSGRNPTRKEKLIMVNKKLNPLNWWVVKNTEDELHIKNKHSKKNRTCKV